MSYAALSKVDTVGIEDSESQRLLNETASVYDHVIDRVQQSCEATVTQLGYRSVMSQFFADWKVRTAHLLRERAQAPPATVPVARPAAPPEAAAAKRAHAEDAGADLLLATGEAPAKRARPEGAARGGYGDEEDDDSSSDSDSDSDGAGARGRRGAGEGAREAEEEEGSDAELGPDLDDDDDTNFNQFCSDVADRVVCLYDEVKKTNKKTVLRVALRDGVIMVRGMPDVVFRHMTANFKYN